MSYVGLKHLLADLALEAVQQPGEVRWPAVAAAYAELTSAVPDRQAQRADVLKRAAEHAPSGLAASETELDYLISRGLLSAQDDGSVALVDTLRPFAAYFERQSPRLLAALADLRRPATTTAAPAVRIGAALFNAGLYFECHEWFEGLWKATSGREKDLLQGIVQAAAAFYHFEKGNAHGCATLMRKARARLARYPSHALGLDLGRFAEELARWDTHVGGGARPETYPMLDLLSPAERAGKE
jgi:uncharacterized protein